MAEGVTILYSSKRGGENDRRLGDDHFIYV